MSEPRIDSERIAKLIVDIESGAEAITPVGSEVTWCGDQEYTTESGWKLCVFIDVFDWDYFDFIESPEGVRIEYPDLEERFKCYRASDEVSVQRYRVPQR